MVEEEEAKIVGSKEATLGNELGFMYAILISKILIKSMNGIKVKTFFI